MKYLKLIKKGETTPTELESGVLYYNENTEKVSCKVAPPTPTVPEGYVDLGLSVYWAKCNVGATKPEEYGLLFQWGATEGHDYDTDAKNYSTWSTAPFNNGSSDYDAAYFTSVSGTVCPNGVLASDYDAAYQATNGVAHMPTKGDFNELTANTTSAWTTVNGVSGITFTSNKEGYTDKYIFIPASGGAYDGSVNLRGSIGDVLSSSLNTDNPSLAWGLDFDSDYMGVYDNFLRYNGYSVRGVASK